ncbi:BspA family leucine-rich repeat surface protein [Mycoplasma feriruminatoris]|uniref:BspA family leucine-rich repeat surface protein n=1 Tax=Mycoplasma feriruminatoris TaxID=1179777 RepID=A0ABY8HXL9_9MOLU|nr:BspA family leucine-rich repeat surface protein [Mycoplasma feriruminatoris]WFQ93585.1 BspA family leucine-rich repeat surface protein [Mycoplasma feriruminatoris]
MKKVLLLSNLLLITNLSIIAVSCQKNDDIKLETLTKKTVDDINEVNLKLTSLQQENNVLETRLNELKKIQKVTHKFEHFTRLYDKTKGYKYRPTRIDLPIKKEYFKTKNQLNKFKNNNEIKTLLNNIETKEKEILEKQNKNYSLKTEIENTKEQLANNYWGWGVNPVYQNNKLVKIGYFLTKDFELQIETIKSETNEVPDVLPEEITSLKLAFNENKSSNIKGLEKWKTHNIKDMSQMFRSAFNFNQNLSNFDTSNVISFNSMFNEASSFDQDLSNWKTDNVLYAEAMFTDAKKFNNNNKKLTWNTKNIVNMRSMFLSATSFNQDISSWNTSSVTNMSNMFFNATSFNQNISNWNVSNVTNMSQMFRNATNFDQNLSKWQLNKNVIYDDFATNSKIQNNKEKLPKFNK